MDEARKVKDEIDASTLLQLLVITYQEHAIEQINFARNSLLSSRDFTQELANVFVNVKTSYANFRSLYERERKKTLEKRKNGKEVLVLISANNKLYGDIIPKVNTLFVEQAKKQTADIVVIGRRGRSMIEQMRLGKPYQYFDIRDDHFTLDTLKPAIAYLYPYEKVTVFYGKFLNILSQDAVASNISGDLPPEQQQQPTEARETFIFEPSLEAVLSFFEGQIFSVLFNQTLREAQMARYASRIKAMESARNNLEGNLTRLTQEQRRLTAMKQNKKQLQLLAGKALWGTGAH